MHSYAGGHGGNNLVASVLPMVLNLAEKAGLNAKPPEQVEEHGLLQALTYLQLLMSAAGPNVPPTVCAKSSDDGVGARAVSLEQVVDELAWKAAQRASPSVSAAAVQCRVLLCLRDGGQSQLQQAVAEIAPLVLGLVANHAGVRKGDVDADFIEGIQLPQRAALQAMVDLAVTWGEPAVTAALGAVHARSGVEAVTAQMETLGMEVDGAPATAKGVAAPALMEFAAEVLAAASAAAAESVKDAANTDEEGIGGSNEATSAKSGALACCECVLLCELVLQELARMAGPGNASLDLEEKGVQAYAAELCKTPMRFERSLSTLADGDPTAVKAPIRRLVYLCRRAVDAGRQSLVGVVVTATAFKELEKFMAFVEKLQQDATPMLTDEEALPALKAAKHQGDQQPPGAIPAHGNRRFG
ncbi:hypothetical protein GPECTOR_33g661 [Gonium pectorale]|uniref:Uncharacterized protein n=1 Tax=Gonium pectorale TaxID=33097 RepID=A0A150GD69_GONPE|nr:hypothetical protein GPECTOR_33g661 [Gonium pectorale]|eukprot:KXZ47779.1 hypothetical protein GPECTOR_33g661 [Gonium pectorale]